MMSNSGGETRYLLEQAEVSDQLKARIDKQHQVAAKQYDKLMNAKKQAIHGRTRIPALTERRRAVSIDIHLLSFSYLFFNAQANQPIAGRSWRHHCRCHYISMLVITQKRFEL